MESGPCTCTSKWLSNDVLFQSLALKLPGAAYSCGLQACALFGRLFIVPALLHLAIDAFALELLFEHAHGLVDIIVANDDLHLRMLSEGAGWWCWPYPSNAGCASMPEN